LAGVCAPEDSSGQNLAGSVAGISGLPGCAGWFDPAQVQHRPFFAAAKAIPDKFGVAPCLIALFRVAFQGQKLRVGQAETEVALGNGGQSIPGTFEHHTAVRACMLHKVTLHLVSRVRKERGGEWERSSSARCARHGDNPNPRLAQCSVSYADFLKSSKITQSTTPLPALLPRHISGRPSAVAGGPPGIRS